MKIMILGAGGQVGRELVSLFNTKKNIRLYPLYRSDLDTTNTTKLRKKILLIQPDVVINTTAYHVVSDCENFPHKAFELNTIAVKEMACLCDEIGSRFITYSTDYVFDGTAKTPYKEDHLPNPLQIYGLSKYAGEIVTLNYCQASYIIRTCGVYGGTTGSRTKKGNFIITLLRAAQNKNVIEVGEDQISTPTYAVDLAWATYQLLIKKLPPGIYHFVNEKRCSWAEFAQEIVRLRKLKVKIVPVKRGSKDGLLKKPLFSVLLNTKGRSYDIILPTWKNALSRYLKTL